MSESLGLTSHKSSCNCTGCGLLRAGVCINCAEKIAALILELRPQRARCRAVLGCLPRGDRAVLLHPARALARAAHAIAVQKMLARESDLSSTQECPLLVQVLKQLFGRSAHALTNFCANAGIVLRHFQN
jgi:hypothetical protein